MFYPAPSRCNDLLALASHRRKMLSPISISSITNRLSSRNTSNLRGRASSISVRTLRQPHLIVLYLQSLQFLHRIPGSIKVHLKLE